MNLAFISPHINYGSGGPKVIFRFCEYLSQLGIMTTLYVHKLHKHENSKWLMQGDKLGFKITELEKNNSNIDDYEYREFITTLSVSATY